MRKLIVSLFLAPALAFGVSFNDSVKIGATGPADSKAQLDVSSTTKGVLLPRMSTTQQNAITSPTEGLLIYDNVLHMLAMYNGTSWLDVFNASNLSAGTLPSGRLPNPSASALGGVESLAAVSHNFLTSISTSGVPVQARPVCADLSDSANSCSTAAASTNTVSNIVLRDGSGNFSAGTITATLSGNATNVTASTNSTLTNLSALVGVGTLTAGTWNASTVGILYGGTGQTTATTAFDALSPLTTAGDTLTYGSGHNIRVGTVLGDLGKFWTSGGALVSNSWTSDGFILTNINAANVTNNNLAVAHGGTGLSSGTSGGLLYYSGSGTLASSAAFATSKVLVGLGTASPPGGLSCSDGQIIKWSSGAPACGTDATGASSFAYRNATTTDSPTNGTDNIIKLSGASFTVTLPTAASVQGQFYIFDHEGANLSQIYTFNTTSAQTIGGYSSGNYVLYTTGEELALYSDGANWQIWNHYARTLPADLGGSYDHNVVSATAALVISWTGSKSIVAGDTYCDVALTGGACVGGNTYQVTTTANTTSGTFSGPVNPSASGTLNRISGTGLDPIVYTSRTVTGQPIVGTTANDIVTWQRNGEFVTLKFRLNQTAAGTSGSGDYIFYVDPKFAIASSYTTPYIGSVGTTLLDATGANGNGQAARIRTSGTFNWSTAYSMGNSFSAYAYSATSFRVATFYYNAGDSSGNIGSSVAPLGSTPSWDFEVTYPVQGWKP